MDVQPCLSICLVSWNTRNILQACLKSIETHPPSSSYEIIVVDNHSDDGTQEMLAEHFPEVHLIVNQSNLGYTIPMNQALRLAKGAYCLQLNPDTLALPGLFDRLIEFLQNNPKVGIVSPKVLNQDGSLQKQCRRSAARPWDVFSYFSGLAALFPNNRFFSGYLMTYLDENETHPAEAVSGSCMLVRREVFQQIGYLDECFFAYQEDADFCFRTRQAGWQIYYLPTAQVIHYGGQGGSRGQPYRGVFEWHRSYYRYYRKNLARDYFFLFNWVYYLFMVIKLVLTLLKTLFSSYKVVGTPKPQA